MFAADDMRTDKLYGHIKPRKRRGEFLAFLRYVRSMHPQDKRLAIILDNFSPHLTTKTDTRVGDYAAAQHRARLCPVQRELAVPDRAAVHLPAPLRTDGTDRASHREQGPAIRRYIAWRNRNPHDRALCRLVDRAKVA